MHNLHVQSLRQTECVRKGGRTESSTFLTSLIDHLASEGDGRDENVTEVADASR